jgi:hypothetical protein
MPSRKIVQRHELAIDGTKNETVNKNVFLDIDQFK